MATPERASRAGPTFEPPANPRWRPAAKTTSNSLEAAKLRDCAQP